MIRLVSIFALLVLLALVLYLPSAYPPERFIAQLRIEHELNSTVWGQERATHMLAAMLDVHTASDQVTPLSSARNALPAHAAESAVANEMSQVNGRLFNNMYFRSIDTLVMLATYRLAAMLAWLPILLVLVAAILTDGFVVRIVKAKEFRQHNPEMYALHGCAAIITACSALIAFVLPITVHPLVLAIVPIALSVFVSRAVANFHRRG